MKRASPGHVILSEAKNLARDATDETIPRLHHGQPTKMLYVGVTSDLQKRVSQHRQKRVGFTSKYNITRLVYHEATTDARAAIAREKQIKGWLRAKKLALVESINPDWDDLAEKWFAADDRFQATNGRQQQPASVIDEDSSLRSE